jgi:quinol-cytochrome oxidoreductase complex cytochrome b subunit
MPQSRWRYTLGAGGLAVFLVGIIIVTGILEMFFYIPTPAQAGPSIQMITFLVPYGGLVRGLHFWAAQALVLVSGIHLLRVIFTGAYHPPRRFNFLLGLGLFVLVILMNFTGYVLRWDNGIHWALIVGTNLLQTIPLIGDQIYRFVIGGTTPGIATLTRFYAWHIFGLTLASIILLAWHIFRVRRDGGISAPNPEECAASHRISRSELVRREVLAMLIASIGLTLLATLVPPPLAAPIMDASMPLNPDVRAPWFFLWVQQLLRFGNAFWMGIAIPLGMLAILGSLPYLFSQPEQTQKGSWFPQTGRIAQIATAVLTLAWLILTLLELLK